MLFCFGVHHILLSFIQNQISEIVAKWIGLNIILTAFYIVPRTKFVIDLNFKIQTKISFVAVVVSGVVGIVLASYGYGVWALVVQSLLNSLISLILILGAL